LFIIFLFSKIEVNQTAAAVLLHHAQLQQQHLETIPMDQSQQTEQQAQHQFVNFTEELPPPVVGVPVGSSTSIHTTVAGSGHVLVADIPQQQQQAPAPTLADIIAAAAAEAASIQHPTLPSQTNNVENMNIVQV
jgi:hypothetical protein